MKKLILLFLVPVLSLGLACSDGGGDDEDGNGDGILNPGDGVGDGSGSTTSNYYPLKTDAYWVMNYTDSEDGTVVGEGEETLRVTGKVTIEGKEYWKIVDEDEVLDSYTRIQDNVLYVIQMDFLPTKAAAMAKAAGVSQFGYLEGEVPMLDFSKSAGKSWTISDTSYTEEGINYSLKWTGTYVGNENVTVPAGTFANCRKYLIVMVYSTSFNNFSYSSETKTTVWLAANVGPVKIIDSDDANDEYSYEYTSVLKEYSIP